MKRALAGSVPNELRASVAVDARREGYQVRIELREGPETRGTTVIDAPTCDEAVDAAAIVLALAFGTTGKVAEPASSPAVPAHAARALPPRSRSSASQGSVKPVTSMPSFGLRADGRGPAPMDGEPARVASPALRLNLATGVDVGTLPQPTLTLAGAFTWAIQGVELTAMGRYGLPIADERVESGARETQRHDFVGVELRACRGVGEAARLSACTGTELGVVRLRHARELEGEVARGAQLVFPRLSGTLAALLAHRGGLIEPGLEVGGAAVALGRDAGAPWLVLRVAAGAAIAF
jgi:hypothetical protein